MLESGAERVRGRGGQPAETQPIDPRTRNVYLLRSCAAQNWILLKSAALRQRQPGFSLEDGRARHTYSQYVSTPKSCLQLYPERGIRASLKEHPPGPRLQSLDLDLRRLCELLSVEGHTFPEREKLLKLLIECA